MQSERVEFPGHDGSRLAARLDLPAMTPRAYALFAHCFTCSKDVLAASRISTALNEQGIAVLRFDFTGLGMSEGEFANTNFSSNVADLLCAANFLRKRHAAPSLLIGHSLGGAAVLSVAPDIPEVRAVATLGAPAKPLHVADLLGREALARLDTEQEVAVSLGGRPFRIQRQFLEDLKAQHLRARIAALRCALLVMHAPADEVVGVDQARRIFEAARHPKSFVALNGANHLLTQRRHAAYAARVIAAWVEPYLPETAADEALAAGQVRVAESGAGRYTQRVQTGRHRMLADEPTSAGGDDAGPGPFDYLLAALGTCTTMTLRMVAERKGWQLPPLEVTLQHRHVHAQDCADCESAQGKVLEIDRTLRLPASIAPAIRQQLLDIADRCPVHRALTGEIKVRTHATE
ncbi:MAG: alpha/beta fold hydrolase [Rhodanobacteraceae bacterium]|nr:MAG: alpha/beta fold hydrolase [Rhodanobacteraceae bacterium]